MKFDADATGKFKEVFKNGYGLKLTIEEAEPAGERLVRFFDLLARFDEEDRKKVFEMEEKRNGKRI